MSAGIVVLLQAFFQRPVARTFAPQKGTHVCIHAVTPTVVSTRQHRSAVVRHQLSLSQPRPASYRNPPSPGPGAPDPDSFFRPFFPLPAERWGPDESICSMAPYPLPPPPECSYPLIAARHPPTGPGPGDDDGLGAEPGPTLPSRACPESVTSVTQQALAAKFLVRGSWFVAEERKRRKFSSLPGKAKRFPDSRGTTRFAQARWPTTGGESTWGASAS